MNVLQETEPGDRIVILQHFSASPEGEGFSWETSREIRVGERVRLVRFFLDDEHKHVPGLGWTVVFDAADGKRYAATQSYFVTEECWDNIKRFFARRVMRDARRPTTSGS